jgi:hypothetical protein
MARWYLGAVGRRSAKLRDLGIGDKSLEIVYKEYLKIAASVNIGG